MADHRKLPNTSRFGVWFVAFLVATFSLIIWRLSISTPSAVQMQSEGQDSPIPTVITLETPTVPVEETFQVAPSVLMTETFVLVAAAELGIFTDEKLSIILIEPGSAAEKAGLQLGDMLESIEGIPLALAEDRREAKRLYRHNLEGKEMHLTVVRNGERLELPFIPQQPPNRSADTPTTTPVFAPYDFF